MCTLRYSYGISWGPDAFCFSRRCRLFHPPGNAPEVRESSTLWKRSYDVPLFVLPCEGTESLPLFFLSFSYFLPYFFNYWMDLIFHVALKMPYFFTPFKVFLELCFYFLFSPLHTESYSICKLFSHFFSLNFPCQDVVDGDLCEQFPSLPLDLQRRIAEELDRTPGEILKKLEDIRNRII